MRTDRPYQSACNRPRREGGEDASVASTDADCALMFVLPGAFLPTVRFKAAAELTTRLLRHCHYSGALSRMFCQSKQRFSGGFDKSRICRQKAIHGLQVITAAT